MVQIQGVSSPLGQGRALHAPRNALQGSMVLLKRQSVWDAHQVVDLQCLQCNRKLQHLQITKHCKRYPLFSPALWFGGV